MSLKRSDDQVWIESNLGNFCRLGAGLTHLEEKWKTALLETPNIYSPVCGREILYHTGELEFEGYWIPGNPAMDILISKHLKRGNDAKVTLIVANRQNAMEGSSSILAHRVTGYVCLENPGTGEGPMGSRIKGKIVYGTAPQQGVFNEEYKQFSPI